MTNFPVKMLNLSQSFRTWMDQAYAAFHHEHSEYIKKTDPSGTVPDYARAVQYSLGPGNSNGLAIVYRIMADGYLWMIGDRTGDGDGWILASPCVDSLVNNAAAYDHDNILLMGETSNGDANNSSGMRAVFGSKHPWFIRFGNANDMIRNRLYFVPFVNTPTQTYLQKVFDPSVDGTGRSVRNVNYAPPNHAILPTNGYRPKISFTGTPDPWTGRMDATFNTDYLFYAKENSGVYGGIQRYLYRFRSIPSTEANPSYIRNTYTYTTRTLDGSGNTTIDWNRQNRGDMIFLYNVGNQWQMINGFYWEDPALVRCRRVDPYDGNKLKYQVVVPPSCPSFEVDCTGLNQTQTIEKLTPYSGDHFILDEDRIVWVMSDTWMRTWAGKKVTLTNQIYGTSPSIPSNGGSLSSATSTMSNNNVTFYFIRRRVQRLILSPVITGMDTQAISRLPNFNFTDQWTLIYDNRWNAGTAHGDYRGLRIPDPTIMTDLGNGFYRANTSFPNHPNVYLCKTVTHNVAYGDHLRLV